MVDTVPGGPEIRGHWLLPSETVSAPGRPLTMLKPCALWLGAAREKFSACQTHDTGKAPTVLHNRSCVLEETYALQRCGKRHSRSGARAGQAGACAIRNVRRVDSRRRRWSGRRGLLDDGKQACRRHVCRDRQQSLVHGCEGDHERDLLSASRRPKHGGHAVHHHGRVDIHRSRTRCDKSCDFDAD